jgi:multiple sugar transport system substrate-binding protein
VRLRARALFSVLICTVLVAACGPGAGQSPAGGGSPAGGSPTAAATLAASGDLNVMGFDCTKGDDIATNRIKAFQSKFPDVNMKCTEGGLNDQVFLTAVRSGNPPDLIYMDRSKIGTFAAQQAIQPMTECVSKAAIDMANFRDAAVRQVTFDSQVYGIPEFFNVVVLVINNKLLQEADVAVDDIDTSNWDALKAANEKLLKKDGNKITRLGFDPKMPEFLPLWAKINGIDILSEDGKTSNLDDPKVAEAMAFTRDLIQAHGKASDFFAAREALSPDFFGAGNPIAGDVLGAFPIEQFFLNVMAGNSPNVDITVKAAKGRDGQDVSYATGLTWAIPEGSKNVDAACAMAATMTHQDAWIDASQKRAAARKAENRPYTGTYTGNKAADQEIFNNIIDLSAMPKFDEAVKATIAVSDRAFAIPAAGGSVDFEKAWRDAWNRVANEGADPVEALKAADSTAQSALDSAGG